MFDGGIILHIFPPQRHFQLYHLFPSPPLTNKDFHVSCACFCMFLQFSLCQHFLSYFLFGFLQMNISATASERLWDGWSADVSLPPPPLQLKLFLSLCSLALKADNQSASGNEGELGSGVAGVWGCSDWFYGFSHFEAGEMERWDDVSHVQRGWIRDFWQSS